MRLFNRILLSIAALAALAAPAAAQQSCPPFTTGKVLTAGQWQACFDAKQNALGYTPLNVAGGTMLGRLVISAPTGNVGFFNLTPGSAPGSPNDGDMWSTSAGFYGRAGGITIGPFASATSTTFAATPPVSVTIPAGVVTYALDYDASFGLNGGIVGVTRGAAGTLFQGAGSGTPPSFTATPTLGVAGTTAGTLTFTNTTSGTIILQSVAGALGSQTIRLPAGTGTIPVTVSAPLALNTTTGALSITGAAGTVLAGATPAFTATPAFGVAGATQGGLSISGATSGTVTVAVQAAAGTFNWNLPTSAGTSGQPLLSGGGGATAMSFGTLAVGAGGTGLTSGTSGGIPYFNASSTMASSAALTANGVVIGGGAGAAPTVVAVGTNGQILLGVTSAAPAFGTMSGDASITNAGVATVAKVNGVAYASGPSTNTVPIITASNTATYTAINNCTGALTYDTTAHTFGCNSSAGTGTVTGPGTSTNNAIATWNSTGGTALFDNSGITISSNNLLTSGSLKSSSATAGIGYSTGAGCSVSQSSSKSTGVTCAGMSGEVTMNAANLGANTSVTFTVSNTSVTTSDVVVIMHRTNGTGGSYALATSNIVNNTSFDVTVTNITGSTLGQAIVLRFYLFKTVTS